jgi:hypothetical protein
MQRLGVLLFGLVLGVVAGFVLGGVRPRTEVTKLRAELAAKEMERRQARRGSQARFLPIPGLSELERPSNSGPGPASEASREGRPGQGPSKERADEADRGEAPRKAALAGEPTERAEEEGGDEEQRRQRFRTAISLQRVRAKQTRAALKERAGLSDEELARVDAVVAKMNESLSAHAEQLMALATGTEEPQPLELLFVTQEVSSILFRSQTEFEEAVGPERLERVDAQSKQIWNLVDLELFEPAADALRKRNAEGQDSREP